MKFGELKIDRRILKALKECRYEEMTEIQSRAIPPALHGSDVIGASETGSGKTLAFIIPVLQKLVDLRWSGADGLGALVLTPTRELALQIFEVLKAVGRYTNFSAGLVMGGMEAENEDTKIAMMNIVVSTPGRLLKHLQEGPSFQGGTAQVLVLDEADKMLEMGFKEDLHDILGHLPDEKQTLLFSATPKASVARILKLKDPEIVCIYQEEGFPVKLRQYYHMMDIREKIGHLYSFIRQNKDSKGVVFFSTCKEVKFVHLLFSKLSPGPRLFCLNGGMSQRLRIETFKKFVSERCGFLFCTDLGARGLDFPSVDVVVQYDCPCNVETYVHRVGRTARNKKEGSSYLYLVYGEEAILADIQKRKWTGNEKAGSTTLDITEGTKISSENVDRRAMAIIRSCREVKELALKYLKTFSRFLEFSSKKYSSKTIPKVDTLYEHFGVTKD
jgi:ATP-dependent RNA helicase DDX10/DBP4